MGLNHRVIIGFGFLGTYPFLPKGSFPLMTTASTVFVIEELLNLGKLGLAFPTHQDVSLARVILDAGVEVEDDRCWIIVRNIVQSHDGVKLPRLPH